MRKKRLFRKVMGITLTAVLTGSSCVSPILAEDIIIVEETGIPEPSAAEAGDPANHTDVDLVIEEMTETDEEASAEGSTEGE